MTRIPSCWLLLALALPAGPVLPAEPAPGQQSPSDAAAALIAWEQARSTVAEALEEYRRPAANGDEAVDNLVNAVDRLALFGPDAVPFLANELEQELVATYSFCAYALGRIVSPESEAALRQALERADEDESSGDWATIRKAWAGWALGLQGREDAVDLFNAGKLKASHYSMHRGTSVIEVAALRTAPASIPRLTAQLDRYEESGELATLGQWTLRALRRVGDTTAVPRIVRLLSHPDFVVRYEAVHALGTLMTGESVTALLGALEDEHPNVRRQAALSLEELRAPGIADRLAAGLEASDDATVRGALYRSLARLGGPGELERLRASARRPDPRDRLALAQALRLLDNPETVPLLRDMLADPDVLVAVEATAALGDLATREAREALLDLVPSSRWAVAQSAVRGLVRLGEVEAAPLIAARIIRIDLPGVLQDVAIRTRVEMLGEALVDLRYPEALPDLRQAAQDQHDGTLLLYLDGLYRRLETLGRNRRKLGRWVASLDSPHPDIQRLACGRLAELGGDKAALALAAAFSDAGPEVRLSILDALGSIPSPHSRELVERVLISPEFDAVAVLPLREMAAWSARRLELAEVLERAIERRGGRDAKVMIYHAVLAREDALPTLAAYRAERMHYLKWTRGLELDLLDELARDIRAGLPLHEVDVPPQEIVYH